MLGETLPFSTICSDCGEDCCRSIARERKSGIDSLVGELFSRAISRQDRRIIPSTEGMFLFEDGTSLEEMLPRSILFCDCREGPITFDFAQKDKWISAITRHGRKWLFAECFSHQIGRNDTALDNLMRLRRRVPPFNCAPREKRNRFAGRGIVPPFASTPGSGNTSTVRRNDTLRRRNEVGGRVPAFDSLMLPQQNDAIVLFRAKEKVDLGSNEAQQGMSVARRIRQPGLKTFCRVQNPHVLAANNDIAQFSAKGQAELFQRPKNHSAVPFRVGAEEFPRRPEE